MLQDLLERLRSHVVTERFFAQPGLALLAVSGGPDSVALLDLFSQLGAEFELELAVAHVDHGIAEESVAVAHQVADLAARYGLPFHGVTFTLDAKTSETRAREARYRALRWLRRRTGARYVVTAHHADDQVETVLLRVLRGTGMAGLAGIPARGRGGLVRPLLPFARRELAQWLAHRATVTGERLPLHHDPANAHERHDRSWVRQRLLPLLRERCAVVDGQLLDLARHAREERSAWASLLRTLPELDFQQDGGAAQLARGPLRRYDKLLSEALLRALAREVGCTVGPRRAARLLRFVATAPSGRRMELGGGWEAEVVFERVRLVRPARAAADQEVVEWGVGPQGCVRWSGWEIAWRRGRAEASPRASFTTWMTAGSGQVRGPEPGDALVPEGGVGHRKVRRLLMEARVSWRERGAYPLLVRGDAVLWVPGVCRSDAAVPPRGARALRVEAHALRDA